METHNIEKAQERFFSEYMGVWIYHPASQQEEWSENLRELLDFPAPGTDVSNQPQSNSTQRLFDLFPKLEPRIQTALQQNSVSERFDLSTGTPRRYFAFLVKIQYGKIEEQTQVVIYIRKSQPMMIFRGDPQSQGSSNPLEYIPETVLFSTDAEGNYTFLGGSALEHLEIDSKKWIGHSIFEFLDGLPDHIELVRRVFDGKILVSKSQFGGHYFDDRFCPIYGSEGELLGLSGIQLDITEKIHTENELKKNTEQLDNLFNSIPDNAYILDLDFRILRANETAKKAFPDVPLLGQRCHEAIHGRETPCEFCPVPKTFQTGEPEQAEYYEEKLDAFFELTSFPLRDPKSGQIIGVTEMARDITDRKRMEESLLRSQILLDELMEVLNEAVYLIDENYTILRGNKAFHDMYPELAPLVGKKCYETTIYGRVCPECAAQIMFETGKATTRTFFEKNSEDKPGVWLELTAFPLYGLKDNQIRTAICIVRDITPKIQLESQLDDYRLQIENMAEKQMQELRINEAKMRTILETSGAAISFADNKGEFTYINGMYKEILGYPEEELLGKHVTCVLASPKDVTHEKEVFTQALSGEMDRFRFTGELRCKNGSTIWGDIYVNVIRGSRKEDTQLISVIVDVTAQQQMVEHLNRAKMAAEEASHAKSQFLATMSHEIRTPLNGVIGVSNLLMETPLQAKQLEYAKLIKASGESLLFLINDILDFSKIEAGKFDLDKSEFIVHDLVESALRILASKTAEKHLEMIATFDRFVPGPLIGDPGRLRQVLVNLGGNALKFTEHGGVVIHVSMDELLPPNRIRLKFSVKDTGIGIPMERQNRLFKSFSQVDASSARNYGGTGLGLAISKKLVELMDGDIHVESMEGSGSTFWFTACFECNPLVLECLVEEKHSCIIEKRDFCYGDPPERCARSGREVAYLKRIAELNGLHVLIVGSKPIKIPVLGQQMQDWGMNAQIAISTGDARRMLSLAQLKGKPFRLIVVDAATKDSLEIERFVREIQDDFRLKDLAIIVLTPLSEDWQRKSWKNPQKMRFVSKPVCCSALLDSIVQLFFEDSPQTVWSSPGQISFAPYSPKFQQENSPQHDGYSIRVLVAEDNTINQIVISEILKNAAMEFTIAENGVKAVDFVRRSTYDIVLMDCQMPQMDGYEATRAIRQWEKETAQPSPIPIIALTANATSEDEIKCLNAGMDAYCSKPIEASQLLEMIRKHVHKDTN